MLSFYNTLTRKKDSFQPLEKGKVGMYVCGPTVYGPAHIGHARTYIAFDFIRRYLELKGFKVKFIENITDVHDDMIKQANKEGISIFELAKKNIKLFFEDMDALHIKKADAYPRVTEHIQEIIDLVKILQEKGFAYETEDGVYFDVGKFKDYGKLSGVKVDKSVTGTRVKTDKYEKEKPMDFALWKKLKPNEPSWESPWGKGRPGWHIECSVMGMKYLGERFDIHGGALDLVFPHHENEIAQSEAATSKKPFVKYWLHTGFLNVEGMKMSKSLGNFIVVGDLLKDFSPKLFRFFVSQVNYRSPIDFSKKAMQQAAITLDRFNDFIQRLQEIKEAKGNSKAKEAIETAEKAFFKHLDNDFDTSNMWASLFDFEKKLNKLMNEKQLGRKEARAALEFLKKADSVFEVFSFEKIEEELTPEQMKLVEEREKLRAAKKWKEADAIRDKLLEQGIQLLDSAEGVKWKKTRQFKQA